MTMHRSCSRPGCPAYAEPGSSFCTHHREGKRSWVKRERRPGERRVWDSAQWRKLRLMHLRSNPLCTVCGGVGEAVDHILAVKDGGEVFDMGNLQTLCRRCHASKSARGG